MSYSRVLSKSIILFVTVFFIIMVRGASAADCGGTTKCNCGDALTSSQTMWYDLNNCTGHGLIILANNITLDLNGFSITGDDGAADYGVYVPGYNYTTIKNGGIYDFRYGIYLNKSSNNKLTGITANSNSYYGILLAETSSIASGSNNILTNITANSNSYRGIELASGSNNILTNITANSNTNEGILISSSSNNRLTGIDVDGITLFGSSNNILTNIKASSKNHGIYLSYGSNNNIFQDGNISSNAVSDVYLRTYLQLTNVNNTFTNVSYNVSKESVESGSQLIRKWYYRAFVNDNLGNNVDNAIITAYNKTGQYNFNLTTDSTGYTPLEEIIDYINNGTRTYSSNYTIYATKPTYQTESHGFNASLGNKYKDIFTLNQVVELSDCGNLGLANTIYTLQNNIYTNGTCFNILANNIILDCQGHKLTGTNSNSGIYLNEISGITIRNCIITNFGDGIDLLYSSNNSIINNTASSNSFYGIRLYSSSNNIIASNTANSDVFEGIDLQNSTNNILTSNTANSNGYGIALYPYSTNNTLTNNTANSNIVHGIDLETSSNNILTNNTANSNGYDGFSLIISSNNILTNNTANSNQQYGIMLDYSPNNTLTNNTAISNANGIWAYYSSNNTVRANILTNNSVGIFSQGSNSTINMNRACGNTILDFSSVKWYSSYGNNNTCDKPDGWNDTGKIGCTYYCTQGIFVVTVLSPQNKSYGTNATWMNVTLNKQASMCFRSLDNGPNVSMTNSSGNWNNKIIGLSNGAHNVKFYCNDTQNNWAFNTTSFFYCYSDITGPTTSVPDGTVNMRDINLLILNFNYKCGESRFNPSYDVNGDCVINMRDINIAIMNFNNVCK